jgi:hypothetical protein
MWWKRSSSGSRPTIPGASSAPLSSPSRGAASSPTPASTANSASGRCRRRRRCSASSAASRNLRGQGVEQRFIPLNTSSFPRLPHAFMPNWGAVDARHGRVLFYDDDKLGMNRPVEKLHFIVAEVSRLPVHNNSPMDTWNAALLICDDDPGPSSGFPRVAVEASTTSSSPPVSIHRIKMCGALPSSSLCHAATVIVVVCLEDPRLS